LIKNAWPRPNNMLTVMWLHTRAHSPRDVPTLLKARHTKGLNHSKWMNLKWLRAKVQLKLLMLHPNSMTPQTKSQLTKNSLRASLAATTLQTPNLLRSYPRANTKTSLAMSTITVSINNFYFERRNHKFYHIIVSK
jgi:hypothetical protein